MLIQPTPAFALECILVAFGVMELYPNESEPSKGLLINTRLHGYTLHRRFLSGAPDFNFKRLPIQEAQVAQVHPAPHLQNALPAAVPVKSEFSQVHGLHPQCSPHEHVLCAGAASPSPDATVVHLQAMPPVQGVGQPHLSSQTAAAPLPSAILLSTYDRSTPSQKHSVGQRPPYIYRRS
ncbi:hypothetical protein Nepgr_018167 [Nepenthes gracilis]|uniref:Uncharacterized protein n=1 Tax=Nepenthes gracilis TaxID=150966 RepID=A0AAD3SU85_NEPGR|nr:hypothetical protein Nepgr_018167 [Nepenthes gracilis]